jgi:hypothetical protein
MSDSDPTATTTPTGKFLPPPIYHLSGAAVKREGDHSHDTWHVRVVHEAIAGHSMPMIVKAVRSQITLAIEVACGMAARELRLAVPQPGLVVADRADLPDIDENILGERLLLVGSHYQRPDALFAEAVDNSPAAEELIWTKVCESPVATQGAAWDELIANPDRHCENVLFDGTTWWLFDHDQALAPAAAFAGGVNQTNTRQQAIDFNAQVNLLAAQLLRRYAGHGQNIVDQHRKLEQGAKRLQALARYAENWSHKDRDVQSTLQLIGVVLGLIHLRLPALAQKLRMRVNLPPPRNSLWT